MIRLIKGNRGQHTAEYAVVIGVVLAAVVGMQTLIQRGIQAKTKDALDQYMNATVVTNGQSLTGIRQFEPYYNAQTQTTDIDNTIRQEVAGDSVTYTETLSHRERTGDTVTPGSDFTDYDQGWQ